MSRTLASNYSTENNLSEKDPIVRVTFSGVTRGYTSGTYSSISSNDRKFIIGADINLQKFDFLTAPFAVAADTFFEILDDGDDVTSTLNGDNLHGVDITTALGFQNIGSGDFLSLPVTTIKKIQYNENNLSYRFISQDARKLLNQNLFTEPQQTQINDGSGITVSDTTITVDSNTGFVDPSNVPGRMDEAGTVRGWLRIGSELISYTALAFGNQFTGCTRGEKRTDAATHEDNEFVFHVVGFVCQNPHDILLPILMCTDDAAGHAYYDLSNTDSSWGQIGNIGLTATEVDIEQIQQIGFKTHGPGVKGVAFQLFLTKKISAISFIEDFILKPMGWYMYLHSSGLLRINSIDRLHIDDEFSSVATLTNDDMISVSMETREDLMINTIKTLDPLNVNGQRVPLTTAEGDVYELDESRSAYGATQKPLEIDTTPFVGMNTSQAQLHLYKWFYLLGNIPATLKIKVRQRSIALEPADYIQITRASLPDLTSGSKGWTNVRGLITGQKISLNDSIELEVFVWDLYTRSTNGFTINSETVVTGGSGRTAVTFSATNSSTLEGADGFHDFAATRSVSWMIVTVTVTKPNESPTGSNESISLAFHLQTPTGTTIVEPTGRFIQYFTEDSDTITYKFILSPSATVGPQDIDRVKVDWYERSTTTGGKQVTVAFTTIQFGTFVNTISTA